MSAPHPLAGLLAYLKREAERRAAGKGGGVVKLRDEEITALAALIRREIDKPEARP